MSLAQWNRTGLVPLLATWLITIGLQACGGGSGSDQAAKNTQPAQINTPTRSASATRTRPGPSNTPTRPGPSNTPTRPGPSHTPTRPGPTDTPTPPGPSDTPTASPTPTQQMEFIVRGGASIAAAAKRAPAGSTIIVAPGNYAPVVLQGGDLQGAITLFADVTGEFTDSLPAQVVIDARGQLAAVSLTDQEFEVVVDGFTLRGGSKAGALVVRSPGTVIADCTMTRNSGDGVRLDQSDGSFIFNNLIWENSAAGLNVRNTADAFVINNTVYRSHNGGIAVVSSTDAVVENNIFNKNSPAGIIVDSASTGYAGNFNLNTDGYGEGTPAGANDIVGGSADPQFIFPSGGDFHLSASSPAIDAGDFSTDPELVAELGDRTTQTDGTLDAAPVDLGFHYLAPEAFATPTPVPPPTVTRTATRRPTPTRTPTTR